MLEPMAAAGGGAVVNVASTAGLGFGDDGLAGRVMVLRGGEPRRLIDAGRRE